MYILYKLEVLYHNSYVAFLCLGMYVYMYIAINLIVFFIIVMYAVYIHTFGNDNLLAWNIDPDTVAKYIRCWGGKR